MRALVTGGAGFIGSHLTDRLIGEGHEVVVLDDFSIGRRDNLLGAETSGRLRVLEGSILRPEDIAAAIDGCELVFHLAVRSVRHSIGDPIGNHHINATGTLNVLEAARQSKVRRFVYCSSSEVYGNATDAVMTEDVTVCCPVTVYGGAKLVGEHYALAYHQTYGMPTVVVRPFNAYGPRSHGHGESGEVIPRFASRILNGLRPLIFGDGSHSRDFTFVTEVAEGIARAATSDSTIGKTVNVAYGRAVSVLELASNLTTLCNRPDLTPEFRDGRPGDVNALHASVTRCRELLGFRPEIALKDGLTHYLQWLQRTVNDPSVLLDTADVNWRLPE